MPDQPPSKAAAPAAPLPLFPLGTVFFPGGHLGLKVFEPRYLDLISGCLRSNQPFGVICLRQGADHGPQKSVQIESVGVLAHIDLVDAERPGLLRVSCTGGQRFRLVDKPAQRENGLWAAHVRLVPDDPARQPGVAMLQTVSALAEAIRKLQSHEQSPFSPPYRLDDAGWVANRWCELLPVSLSAKQKLMELDDPVIRLSLVDGFLRDKKVVVG
jgi:Lon protease-like protein